MAIKTQYTIKSGDTTSKIALKYQVTVQQIIDLNPNVFTPGRPSDGSLIYPGEVLNIPTNYIDELKEIQSIKADAADETTIMIDGKKCPLPHDFELIEYFDSCSDSFNIAYPYSPELKNPVFDINIDGFKTKGLPGIIIYIGSDPALTGQIEVPSYKVTPSANIQTVSGRSETFILEKSDILPSIKREYINLTFPDIVGIICNAYGIGYEIQSGLTLTEPFPKVTIEDNEKPFTFLSRLARERGVLVGKTGSGKLEIKKAIKSVPVANFKINSDFLDFIGVQELEFTFDTRSLYGQYQGKTSTTDDQNLISTVKSTTLNQQSIKITDYSDATEKTLDTATEFEEQKAIRDFYNNAIPFPSWLNPNTGTKWKTGDLIVIEAPEVNIKSKTMMIKSITFSQTSGESKTAVLNLIPEEVYL